jgi:hypothetical protein
MGLPESSHDSVRTKWLLLCHKPSEASAFELDQVYLMIGKEKQLQVVEALKAKPAPVQQLPVLSFSDHYQAQDVSFETHMQGRLPPPKYLPLHLDIGDVAPVDEQSTQEQAGDFFRRYMMV